MLVYIEGHGTVWNFKCHSRQNALLIRNINNAEIAKAFTANEHGNLVISFSI
jgi:hypothetical protein